MTQRATSQQWILAAVAAVVVTMAAHGLKLGAWSFIPGLAAGAALVVRPRSAGGVAPPPRLQVEARLGLSARTGIALVTADGERFLLVHGDRFAQLQPIGSDLVAIAERTKVVEAQNGWLQ